MSLIVQDKSWTPIPRGFVLVPLAERPAKALLAIALAFVYWYD